MLIKEITESIQLALQEEIVGRLTFDDIEILVNKHALDRARQRRVSPRAVDYSLGRLFKIKNKLAQIPAGKRIWVYDWNREIALGLRRTNPDRLIFMLNTVYDGRPSKTPGIDKIIGIHTL